MASFFQHLMQKRALSPERHALEAVDILLIQENHVLDRKEADRLEATSSSIVIYSWGFDSDEVIRKQGHILRALEAEGLKTRDHGFFQDGTGLGHLEGVIEIRASENGGFEGILAALSHRVALATMLQSDQYKAA